MGDLIATVVIEARSLIREALVSLIESHSYKVICSIGSPADIDCNALKEEQPKLVMLGALPGSSLADTTSRIRRCWHAAKIIVLFDNISSEDLQQLIASDVDLCIPMDASPRALINTLQLIVCEPIRVFVVGGAEITHGLSTQTLKNGEALAAEVVSSLQAPSSIAMPCAISSEAKVVIDGADSDYRLYALSRARGADLEGACTWLFEQDDCPHACGHRGDHKDPYEGHLAQNSRFEPNPGCDLGSQELVRLGRTE
jgi:hypothetical protein